MAAGSGGRHYERLLATTINFFAFRNSLDINCKPPAGSDKFAKDIQVTGSKPLSIEVKNAIGERPALGQFQLRWSRRGWFLKSGKNTKLAKQIFTACKPKLPKAFGFKKLTYNVVNELRHRWTGEYFQEGKYGGFDVFFIDAESVGLNSAELIKEYYKGNDGIQVDGYGLYGFTDKIVANISDYNPVVKVKFRVKYHGGWKNGDPKYSFTMVPVLYNVQKSSMDLEDDNTLRSLLMEEN